ncbi:hypothetical protein ACVWU4_000913 [Campylobacter coli]
MVSKYKLSSYGLSSSKKGYTAKETAKAIEDAEDEAYSDGYGNGYNYGYADGYNNGFTDACNIVNNGSEETEKWYKDKLNFLCKYSDCSTDIQLLFIYKCRELDFNKTRLNIAKVLYETNKKLLLELKSGNVENVISILEDKISQFENDAPVCENEIKTLEENLENVNKILTSRMKRYVICEH